MCAALHSYIAFQTSSNMLDLMKAHSHCKSPGQNSGPSWAFPHHNSKLMLLASYGPSHSFSAKITTVFYNVPEIWGFLCLLQIKWTTFSSEGKATVLHSSPHPNKTMVTTAGGGNEQNIGAASGLKHQTILTSSVIFLEQMPLNYFL